MKLNILNVNIDNLSLSEILDKIRGFLNSSGQHYLVTTNPEFIMAAQHDDEFKSILNKADLSIADGVGIKFAAKRFGQKLQQRVAGVDLMWEISKIASEKGKSVFLLGAKKKGVAEQTAWRLIEKYPKLQIVGADGGFRRWLHRSLPDEKIVEVINRRQPDILFVALGQVKQEKWIYHHLPKLPSVKLAMGVGGSFDYISGHIKRAPQWIRSFGLEWFYRLLRQPWRLPRIITAVIKFSLAVLKHR